MRPKNHFFQTFIDEAIVLSGVEITITDNEYYRAEETKTIFLSMGELAGLLKALQKDLAVYFEQYDWSEDWT